MFAPDLLSNELVRAAAGRPSVAGDASASPPDADGESAAAPGSAAGLVTAAIDSVGATKASATAATGTAAFGSAPFGPAQFGPARIGPAPIGAAPVGAAPFSLAEDSIIEVGGDSTSARDALIRAITPQVRAMVLVRLAPGGVQAAAVEDLTQETLLAVSTGLPRLRTATVAGLRAFASGIVANKVADWLRRVKRDKGGPPASLDSTIHALSGLPRMRDLLPGSGLSVGSLAAKAEAVAGVLMELGELSERHRDVITLAFFDQLTVNQIAERLELSRSAASMLLLRAVRTLRRRLTGFSRVGDAHARRT